MPTCLTPSIALVQDALPFLGGAERVLETTLEVYPAAPVYTLVYNPQALAGTHLAQSEIHTSFINRLPLARQKYRSYLPLMPLAIEQFDLGRYDIVLSFNYAVAHGVLVRPDQLHLSFTHTPLRQAWHFYHQFLRSARLEAGPKSWAARLLLHYLRLWDQAAAARVDQFIVPSRWVARAVKRTYNRPAEVLYPPVEVDRFCPLSPRGEYYVAVSRLVAHKKVGLIVEAFSRQGLPLVIVGDGPEEQNLRRKAAPNVRFLGRQPQQALQELLGRAKAFVHMAEEDFGIAPVEAQAAGCPVIAYGRGGLLDTVIAGETGLFFPEQSAESLIAAVQQFERAGTRFDVGRIRQNALRFAPGRYRRELACLVNREWERFGLGGL
jgi:glycosyltransferase involved in cell wall biosynthesis